MEIIEVVFVDYWKKVVICKKERLIEIYVEIVFSEIIISEIFYLCFIYVI